MPSLPPIVIVPDPSMTPTDYNTIYQNAISSGYSPQQIIPTISAAMLGQGFTQAQIGDAISMPGSISNAMTLSSEPGANGPNNYSLLQQLYAGSVNALTALNPAVGVGMDLAHKADPNLPNVPKTPSLFSPTTWGNYGLVIFGAILALGALLISQKETVIKVGSTAAKAGAILG